MCLAFHQGMAMMATVALCLPMCRGFCLKPTSSISSASSPSNMFMLKNPLQDLMDILPLPQTFPGMTPLSTRPCKARELVTSLIIEEKCFATESGARAFGEACAVDVVYEDCFAPKPFLGKEAVTSHMVDKVKQRRGRGDVRIDQISDGNIACGYAWTYVSNDGEMEGLRGTTFVELNNNGEISYIREIPEPLYKPGDLTIELLKAVTKGAEPKPRKAYQSKTPKTANQLAKYLFLEVQGSNTDEAIRFFSKDIVYRDFNYEEPLRSPEEVRQFIEDFSFPGIQFKPDRFDDGIDATCFTWEVTIEGQETSIKGVSFYKMDPMSRQVTYVRDIPESALKPPPLGALARLLQPGLGVFSGVPAGSRPGGL